MNVIPPPERFIRLRSLITVTLTTLLSVPPAIAVTPEQARIDNYIGNSSELLIRRDRGRDKLEIGSVIQSVRDALITAQENTSVQAALQFLAADGTDLNFFVKTNPHSTRAIYYFPCQIDGGDFYLGWGLLRDSADERGRGCENGVHHSPGRASTATAEPTELFDAWATLPKQIAQGRVQQIFYCGASGGGQIGFATATTGDPCNEALQQCQTKGGGNCVSTNKGFWWSHETDLHATLACEGTRDASVVGTGETLAAEIETLIPQIQGELCGLQVYRDQDFVIVPASDDIVLAQGDDEILVRTRDSDTSFEVEVLEGAINVRSRNHQPEPQLVTKGQRYIHTTNYSEVTTFNRQNAIKFVEMEVLCTFASQPTSFLDLSICTEAGLDNRNSQNEIAFCNLEQASGGQAGDQRTVQMGVTQGEIVIDYEMYGVTDRLQVIYEGKSLSTLDSTSGNQTLSIPFRGQSGRVEVIVTGNQENSGTEWEYTLRCPR